MSDDLVTVPRTEVPPSEWNAFVEASDEAWLWHRHAMQDALATWPGKRDVSFAMRERPDGPLVAIMPLQTLETPRMRRIPFVRMDSLGGPALPGDLPERLRRRVSRAVMDQVLRRAGAQRTTRIDVALAPLAPAYRGERCPRVNPLLALGLANSLTQTWMVDLRAGIDAVWRGMQGRARTAVRKAEGAGVTVRAADGSGDVETYHDLHRATCARTGAAPLPRGYFHAIWEHFVAAGLAQVFFAEHDGRVVAARNFAVDKAAAVCWTAASDDRGLEIGANNLLQWHAMTWMIESGVEWSETGEAFPAAREGKSQGLTQFKESFGGELYPIYRGRLELDQPLARRLEGVRALFARRRSVNGVR